MMQKEEKEKDKISQVHYLDEFVDVTIHTLIKGRAREDPQFLSSEDLLCPHQREASIVLNARQARISFLFPLINHTWLLPNGSNLFDRGSRGSCPRCLCRG